MKPLILVPFHDRKWLNNCYDNLNQTVKCDHLYILNGTAKDLNKDLMSITSDDGHAYAINAGVAYARDNHYTHVICFDSDDYYGENYIKNYLKLLEQYDYVGKQSIYTKFSNEEGLYLFNRNNRGFLFATIAGRVDKFLPVNHIFQNCSDWCQRMDAAGSIGFDSGKLDYCYLRHGNNKHWISRDLFVKHSWKVDEYFPNAKISDVNDVIRNGVYPGIITDNDIFEEMAKI